MCDEGGRTTTVLHGSRPAVDESRPAVLHGSRPVVLVRSGGRAMRPAAALRAGTFCDSAALLAMDDAYRRFVLPYQFLPTSGMSCAGAVLELEASSA